MANIQFHNADSAKLDISNTAEYRQGWNSAINANIFNPYGYDGNEKSVRWDAGRFAAIEAFLKR